MNWRFASVLNIYASDLFNESKATKEDSERNASMTVSQQTPLEIDGLSFQYDVDFVNIVKPQPQDFVKPQVEDEVVEDEQVPVPAGMVIHPLSLRLDPGQRVVIKGKSGSGKSTLLKLLSGFETPTAGEIRLGTGTTASVTRETWRRHVLMVSQKWSLFNGTILDNMIIGTGVHGISAEEMQTFLKQFGLDSVIPDVSQQAGKSASTGGGQMSGGMGKLIVLCRAFLRILPDEMFSTFFRKAKRTHPLPHVILFDEPLAALDAVTRQKVSRLLRTACPKTAITLFIMHNDEMDSGCTVYEMSQGELKLKRS
jgi:ABC-type transport system involved in cytochrome bd biosynthesis fused ATPase/permease subunit